MDLHFFCVEAIAKLRGSPNALDLFLDLRYHQMGRLFPHDIFSVAQANLDFFERVLAHLGGEPYPKSDEKPSIYEMNYRRWIQSHQSSKLGFRSQSLS